MQFKVYYLDDEEALCDIFKELFARPDVEIVTFTDAADLMSRAAKAPPNLLFVDYRLVGTTGEKVAKAMNLKCPVVLVTGDLSVTTDYCFARVLEKPCREKTIADLIESYRMI